jgi:hypothetical protein
MKSFNEEDLKLIYVLKVGYDSKYNGIFEFIFSTNETNIDAETWGWDLPPACNYAQPPDEDFVDKIVSLKTSQFDLFCLHEAVDREYMHGYHTIHALAYEMEPQDDENEGFKGYEEMFETSEDEPPLLVFHYGMTLKQIKDLLYERKFVLKNDSFVTASSIEL